MNFFKSVFSDDHADGNSDFESPPDPPTPSSSSNPNPNVATITTAWTFGSSLIKTLASKSESVIETYRRDLEEFSSGLKKETAVIREAATRAVKDLPTSLEAGAAVAQESLESVGQVIDNLGSTVTEIIAQGKDSILAADIDSDTDDVSDVNSKQIHSSNRQNSKPYSRLDAQIRMIQCDMNTYLEDPEDLDEYNEWKSGFVLDDKVHEIDDLIGGNGDMEELHNEIVPSKVADDLFWTRYFYRVYKIKRAEEARANLVKRVISGEEEEELTWDVDEDDYEESGVSKLKGGESEVEVYKKGGSQVPDVGKSVEIEENEDDEVGVVSKKNMGKLEAEAEAKFDEEVGNAVDQKGSLENRVDLKSKNDSVEAKSDERTSSDGKTDKDSDFSVISSQPSHEEEYGWDEIEDDVGTGDEVKVAAHGSPSRGALRKRLSVAAEEEDEDLTWDIEDDDEPVRS